jgi:hypothetical protein
MRRLFVGVARPRLVRVQSGSTVPSWDASPRFANVVRCPTAMTAVGRHSPYLIEKRPRPPAWPGAAIANTTGSWAEVGGLVLGHAGHDAQCRTTFKSQHAGAGLRVELLAHFGNDGTPSNKTVLNTTCRQILGSKHRFALILPSTVAPHALRYRFPHHRPRVCLPAPLVWRGASRVCDRCNL